MRMGRRLLVMTSTVLALLGSPRTGIPQEPVTPAGLCRAQPCGLAVEWGVGGTPGCQRMGTTAQIRSCAQGAEWTLGGTPDWNDPRYGPASEFPGRIHQYLAQAGYRFTDDMTLVKLQVFIRPEVTKAMCDVV